MKTDFSIRSFFLMVSGLSLCAFSVAPLPKVFVIGDSISMQYGPDLQKFLTGKALYSRKNDTLNNKAETNLDFPKGANGGDSKMVLTYLKYKLKDVSFQPQKHRSC